MFPLLMGKRLKYHGHGKLSLKLVTLELEKQMPVADIINDALLESDFLMCLNKNCKAELILSHGIMIYKV